VRRSFAVDLVPEILAAAESHDLDALRLGPSLPMAGRPSVARPGSF
jgi:hypothetical protein